MTLFTDILPDEDGDAGIHIGQLAEAISVWAWMQPEQQTVADAALAFNTTPQFVRDAIAVHPWCFVSGPEDNPMKQTIEHDGE